MPNLPLENLGRIGLETDKAPYELTPEAWSAAQNMRFDVTGAHKFFGHEAALGTPLHAPYFLFPWFSSTGFTWLYVGLLRVGRINGVTHTDVTRFTTVLGDDNYAAATTTRWSAALLGDLPVFVYNGSVDPPQAYNSVNGRFEDLANWPASTFAEIIRVVDRHLVAMRIEVSSVFDPRRVRWSQPADPGSYPASWDFTNPATGAGAVTLAETQGEIMTAELLNNSMLIYKQDSVITMRFVGGQNIFRFDTLFGQFGAANRYAVGVLENAHVVMGKDDVILHNGSTFKSIIDIRNRQLLFDNIADAFKDNVQVVVDRPRSEVWIGFPDITSVAGELTKAFIWNYRDNTWSSRDLQAFTFMAPGLIDASFSTLYDNLTRTYASMQQTYHFENKLRGLIASDVSLIHNMNAPINTFNGTLMNVLLERTGLPIVGRDRQGEWRTDLDSRKFIRRVHLKVASSGSINVSLGGQETANGPVSWDPPIAFDSSVDSYIDCRINTRFFAIKFESATDITWTVNGYTIDLDVIGQAPR